MLLGALAVSVHAEETPAPGAPPRVLKELLAKGVIQGVPTGDFFSRVFGLLFRCGAFMVKPGEREPALAGECKLNNGPYRYRVTWGLTSSWRGELVVFDQLSIRVAYLSRTPVPLADLYRQLPKATMPTYLDHADPLYRTDCGTAESFRPDNQSNGRIVVGIGSHRDGGRCSGTLADFTVTYVFPMG